MGEVAGNARVESALNLPREGKTDLLEKSDLAYYPIQASEFPT